MNILITGHRGFIGQNMTKLFDAPENNVFVWDWKDNGFPSVKDIDWCIHLGGISSTAETDVDKIMNQNYDFSRWLLNECNTHKVNFQFASSASVYGPTSTFAEDAPVNPQSPYAWSKYLFERYAMKISSSWSIRIQGFRYFNVYGAHEEHKDQSSPYTAFERQAKETGVIKLFEGSEHFQRDFVPVETVCDVHKKFMNVEKNGVWNIGTGKPTSFADIAKTVADKTGARIEYIPVPDNLSKQYQKYTCADLTKIRQEIEL